jgi:hypothetical protein
VKKERIVRSIVSLFMLLRSSKSVMQVAESDNVYFDFFASKDVALQRKRFCAFKGTVCRHYAYEWFLA